MTPHRIDMLNLPGYKTTGVEQTKERFTIKGGSAASWSAMDSGGDDDGT